MCNLSIPAAKSIKWYSFGILFLGVVSVLSLTIYLRVENLGLWINFNYPVNFS